MAIGKLEKVNLRELWKNEERDFTAWLEANIEALSEVLGMSLSVVQREKATGPFQADLVAEDSDGNLVIIENQLEPTDHDHLGKVVTYLTNLEAKTAVWVASEPRPEHIRAVAWLNEATPADVSFYLVRVAAYRIGDSDPAPLFAVVVAPTAETKAIGKQKKELAERHILRLRFWQQLLDLARKKGITVHANVSPSKDNWISAGAGRSGLSFNYVIWLEDRTAIELYIDTGEGDQNKRIFDELHSHKEDVEAAFGSPLSWERLDDRRASRIRFLLKKGGLKDESNWVSIQDALIDAMDRLAKAIRPYIQTLHG